MPRRKGSLGVFLLGAHEFEAQPVRDVLVGAGEVGVVQGVAQVRAGLGEVGFAVVVVADRVRAGAADLQVEGVPGASALQVHAFAQGGEFTQDRSGW